MSRNEVLPRESEAGISNGIWFVWHDGDNIIRAWASLMNGMERVWFNERLVSEKRQIKIRSEHAFDDAYGNSYTVFIRVESMMKGILTCEFSKNGELKKGYLCRYTFGRLFTFKNLVIYLAGVVLTLLVAIVFDPPQVVIFLMILILIAFIFKFSGKRFSFEEIDR